MDKAILRARTFSTCMSSFRLGQQRASLHGQTTRLEAERPLVKTPIPGPKSRALLNRLDNIQAIQSIKFFVNYEKSYGNYLVDADDNVILDCFMQIASAPLGYNPESFRDAFRDPANEIHFINRPSLGVLPSTEWPERLENSLLAIAPKGMRNVQTMACGACANEHAFKAVFLAYMRKKRGEKPPTAEELSSCVMNKEPGCPPLTILSFVSALHGRTMGCLNTTHLGEAYKLDFPQSDWPIAEFPILKYPLSEHVEENRKEEERCLETVRSKLSEYNAKAKPVAAVIVEPIQAEGGDNYASPRFFNQLQQICKQNEIYFVVDEVQTGCGATGRWWEHESWDLPQPPDIVTFSKKAITGGFYHTDEMRPTQPNRIFNTWMGDPSKIVLLEAYIKTVNANKLLEQASTVGLYMIDGLHKLQVKYPGLIANPRGAGTLCAVDTCSTEYRTHLIAQLLQKGIQTSGCGSRALRMRPALIFEKKHADIVLNALEDILKEGQI